MLYLHRFIFEMLLTNRKVTLINCTVYFRSNIRQAEVLQVKLAVETKTIK
jgi:hypothetical protein